jgi:hypothetical protein
MCSTATTFLLFAAIMVQGVFGSLQGSVLICLGGGHEHAPAEVVEHCDLACTHHSDWPTPASSDEHIDDCACTDFELSLIVLLMTPPSGEHDLGIAALPAPVPTITQHTTHTAPPRGPPHAAEDDPGGRQRLAAIRSTRLLV